MGTESTSTKQKIDKEKHNSLFEKFSCPFCKKEFSADTSINQLNKHIKKCGINYVKINKECEIYSPSFDYQVNDSIFENSRNYIILKKDKSKYTFDDKLAKLKNAIKAVKISWEEGCCTLNLTRSDFLNESMEQIKKVDLHKELKINFKGEVSYDAGGIMREWFTTIFQTLEGEKLKLFIQSDTNEFSYIINPFLAIKEDNKEFFVFIGKLLVKALYDNITVNVCFNKLLYKMILQEEITFEDLAFIDSSLYNSIKNLKDTKLFDNPEANIDAINDLDIYYSLEMKDVHNHMHTFELKKNGKDMRVVNLEDYIKHRINFMIGTYEPFVKIIRNTIFQYIPNDVITNFNSDELELIINGRPYIDVEEWKMYTKYKEPYNERHYIIIWFWKIVSNLDQNELSNLLLFSTGSSRVPLGGFSALESNRGNVANYTIESIPYRRGYKNFIKAHTCFNRLDLPVFSTEKELKEAIDFITKNKILGFGID